MKPLSKEESDRRITLALKGRDDDGETEADSPVVGLRVLPDGRRYRMETLHVEKTRFLVIGATSRCHIQLEDPHVSGVHCLMVRNRRTLRVYIFDASSTNGLMINGLPTSASELDPGDTITIGNTHLYAFSADEPEGAVLITASNLKDFVRRMIATLGSEHVAATAIGKPRTTIRGWLESWALDEENGK
jgi:hypothetical protein